MTMERSQKFHGLYDYAVNTRSAAGRVSKTRQQHFVIQERALAYQFYPHFHPYVDKLIQRLIEESVRGLQAADTDYRTSAPLTLPDGKPRPVLYEEIFSESNYAPSELVVEPHPVKDLDFTPSGAYSVYNWELFFHVPFSIAVNLSKNHRFEEAQRWFHYVFDPTDNSQGPTPERFWKVKPFQFTHVRMIEEILVNLSANIDPQLQQDTINSIGAWKDTPFRPHVLARFRQSAYMFKTVMAYLDNLIAWGDGLFRQDTGESINEATQLYVLAANILGPRPQAVPKKGSVRPQTYLNLRDDLSSFGNALREFETDIPFDTSPHPDDSADLDQFSTLRSIGHALYFCIPRNEKLLAYWDIVADRLFKIRNSLNMLGIFRQLPLFEPPIDPAMLARATAAGLDIAAVVSGTNQPLPLVRFQLLLQKAVEICQEVKSLGASLLAAMEKEDGEALAILRAQHEGVILAMVESVKFSQLQEAIKAREALEKSLINAAQRLIYYERQLGTAENAIQIPTLDAVDKDKLEKKQSIANNADPEMALRNIVIDIVQAGAGGVGSVSLGLIGAGDITGGKKINRHEFEELDQLEQAQLIHDAAALLDVLGAGLSMIPQLGGHVQPLGPGASVNFGGEQLSKISSGLASAARGIAGRLTYEANRAAKMGSYARREQEWAFQSNQAAGDITQLFKQLRAAQIREVIAELELKNHRRQIANAGEIQEFLNEEGTAKKGKKTNKALYAWMNREVKGLHGQAFQFAFDTSRKAERALQHELGDPALTFLQFDYASGKEGLLTGEKLALDLKRMEIAYYELNRREYELTKHASLLQLNPKALMQLRSTGRCAVSLPEELFDMDGPGHFFRRLKSVAVSIPCVTGPYSSINCTLTLLKSSIRIKALLKDGSYERADAEDDRFSDHFGSLQSIVTSTAQSDSGLFETNLRDERYLPFEGSGAISDWQLELPGDVRQFDYDTISDVIIHLRYTAREGGGLLRNGAIANLKSHIDDAAAIGSVRLFSIRHEFPAEWAKLKTPTAPGAPPLRAELTLKLREEHYPFWSQGHMQAIKRVDLFARTARQRMEITEHPDGSGNKDTMLPDASLGKLRAGRLEHLALPSPTGTFTLYFDDNSMQDLWLALTWGKAE